ncbi:MAG: hypothetical protein ABIH46_10570 [Chloroflexota bacterium]
MMGLLVATVSLGEIEMKMLGEQSVHGSNLPFEQAISLMSADEVTLTYTT